VRSVVLSIALHAVIVDLKVAFNDSGVGTIFRDDRRSVEVDLVVDNEKRVVGVDDIVVNRHTIKVLLKEILEEKVLLFKSSLLLLDSKLVKVDLVVPLVEIVQALELIEGTLLETSDSLNLNIRVLSGIGVALVERKDFLLLSLKFAAKFSSLKNLFTQSFIRTKFFHAVERVGGEST
jgi:hypothetical protein